MDKTTLKEVFLEKSLVRIQIVKNLDEFTMFIVTSDNDPLYQGWVENVKSLKKAKISIHRIINRQLKSSKVSSTGDLNPNDLDIISNLSKSAFLIYSSYTEANLLKLIHLPNSFTESEVTAILSVKDNKSIIQAWFKAIEFASSKNKISITGTSSINDCKLELRKVSRQFLKDPSEIRNKIIHGQWSYAYNKKIQQKNTKLTQEINEIDIARIDSWYKIFDQFAELLKQLIQSPNKGFPVQYMEIINKIQDISTKSVNWSLKTKRSKLLKTGGIPKDVT